MTAPLVELTPKRSPNDTTPQPGALKPPVDPATLIHKSLAEAPDFRRIPAYANVSDEQFLDHHWQAKKSITRPDKLLETCAASSRRSSSATRPRASLARR
jgi:lysine 2,3-aminomutase